jgi:hypothetical protein
MTGQSPPATTDWQESFTNQSADPFADDVVLEATTLLVPITGRDQVKAVIAAASRIYESMEFTHESVTGDRSYAEWNAVAFGGEPLSGVTILERNSAGQIRFVAIHHRPWRAATKFAEAIRDELAGVVDVVHFVPVKDE